MDKEAKTKAAELFTRKAAVIEEIMKLRHQQAKIKAEIAKLSVETGDFTLNSTGPRCW